MKKGCVVKFIQKLGMILGAIKHYLCAVIKIIVYIVIGAFVCAFFVVPFLRGIINRVALPFIWIPSCAIFLMCATSYLAKEKDSETKRTIDFLGKWGVIAFIIIFASIAIINYYNIDYIWMWIIFGVGFVYIPFFFVDLLRFSWGERRPDKDRKHKSGTNAIKYILLYWLYDFLYLSIFNKWLIWIFIFGTLAVVIILVNLAREFLSENKVLQFMLPVDLILGAGLSVYLIYIIPDTFTNLQTIITTIVAALYGGLLTLVGVAWTFRRNYKDNVAKEKKENTPYLCVESKSDSTIDIKIGDKGNYILGLRLISNEIFLLKGVLFDGKFICTEKLIPPKSHFTLTLNINDYDNVALVGTDVLGNDYQFDLNFYIKETSKTKMVHSISLPIEIDTGVSF